MTKRRKLTLALSVLTLSLVSVGAAAGLTDGFRRLGTEEVLSATPVENIRFLQVQERVGSDGVIEKEIRYQLEPSDAIADEFDCALLWSPEEDANRESDGWKTGKDVADYMTYVLDVEEQKLTFRCLQPFGHEIVFSMASAEDPDIQASLSMDYRRKLVKGASIQANNVLEEGVGLTYDVVQESYSIGTIGERGESVSATAGLEWKDEGRSLADMMGTATVVGAYSEAFRYQGQSYQRASDLVQAVAAKTTEYFQSLVGETTAKAFHEEELKEVMTYEYFAYRTFEDVYLETTKVYRQFVENYQAEKDGSGYYLTVDAGGKASYSERVELKVELTKLTGIEFVGGDRLEF